MRVRSAPALATWLLTMFCSSSEQESLIGDLLEQYQRGRSPFWYWRQVIAIVFLGLNRKARSRLVSANHALVKHGVALVLFTAVLSALLLSEIWMLFLIGIVGGVIAAGLIGWSGGRTEPRQSEAPGYHPGISIHHIPVEGGAGLLFVVATILIFGSAIAAVREMLVITAPLGIFALGILIYWHKRHPVKIQALDLDKQKQS